MGTLQYELVDNYLRSLGRAAAGLAPVFAVVADRELLKLTTGSMFARPVLEPLGAEDAIPAPAAAVVEALRRPRSFWDEAKAAPGYHRPKPVLKPARRAFGGGGGGAGGHAGGGGGLDDSTARDPTVAEEKRVERLLKDGTRALRDAQNEPYDAWDRVLTGSWEEPPTAARPARIAELRGELVELRKKYRGGAMNEVVFTGSQAHELQQAAKFRIAD